MKGFGHEMRIGWKKNLRYDEEEYII